jgi:hypothetical protein
MVLDGRSAMLLKELEEAIAFDRKNDQRSLFEAVKSVRMLNLSLTAKSKHFSLFEKEVSQLSR